MRTATERRRDGVKAAEDLAAVQNGIVSRRDLAALGVTRHDVRRELARGRWRQVGRHTIAAHRGPLPREAGWRVALVEVGSRARLDGSTALAAAGMTGYDDVLHVSVPHGSDPVRVRGVAVHEMRGWAEPDVTVRRGLRLTDPAVAAVHAATWARTRRQAALLLAMPVQQRLTTGSALLAAVESRARLRWRPLMVGVARDVADGAQSLGELDLAAEFRRRGLPSVGRQVVCSGRRGRVYLDVRFSGFEVAVEVEGAHHDAPANAIDDALRQNELSVGSTAVLRVPVIGWRVDPEPFLNQIERALRVRGWRG